MVNARMHDDYAPSVADWIVILSISTRLICEKVRERATKEISTRASEVDPFELIKLAVKHDVEKWLKPAYRRIVVRSDPITHQEALKVPIHMAVMVMRAREKYWKKTGPGYHYQNSQTIDGIVCPWGSPDAIIDSEIRVMESAFVEPERDQNRIMYENENE
jgi:hypothetical protein